MELLQGHTVSKWQKQDSNPGLYDSKVRELCLSGLLNSIVVSRGPHLVFLSCPFPLGQGQSTHHLPCCPGILLFVCLLISAFECQLYPRAVLGAVCA